LACARAIGLRRRLAAAGLLGLLLVPGVAQAHLVTTGMGPVYDGISHFAFSPEEIIPVLALGLLAGLRGPRLAREVLVVLPAAWLAGGLIGGFVGLQGLAEQIATAVAILVVGGLLAAEPKAPRPAILAAALGLGLLRGIIDMSGFAASGASLLALLGVVVSVAVLAAIGASVSLPLKTMWSRIAVRYAGSCMAALGLLLMGWVIHASQAAR
jgi:urease accessory protein